ncbi:MAG: hypothetical protein HY070_12610, partial [Chloroflexi bacterium]|nr:hypothetical protein [Chloroflexota bacterium]
MNFSIELAPNWKRGLTLNHPVMIVTPSWDSSPVGAIVTPPLTARLRARAADPRVIDLPGGFLLNSRAANPGVSQFVEQHQRAWEKSVTPIIVALAAQAADDWAKLAARLERGPGVSGIELHLNPVVDAVTAIQQTRAATDLPILAKLDLENARAIVRACLDAGANALVISRAPRGARVIEGKIWRGRMYGPFVQPMVLNALN